MNPAERELLARLVVEALRDFDDDDDRLDFIRDDLTDGYCLFCGGKTGKRGCMCMRDD